MINFGTTGKFSIAPENRDAFIAILIEAAELMQDIDGCHLYVVSKDTSNDTDVWVMELWTDKDAHRHALSLPEVRALIGQGMPMIVGSPEGTTLTPVGGKGL